jgi:hypothetical protein
MASSGDNVGNDGAKVSGTKDRDFDSLIAHNGLTPEKKDRAQGARSPSLSGQLGKQTIHAAQVGCGIV